MSIAENVYTSQADIDRLQALVAELDNGAHVLLRLEDGTDLVGIVSARPVMHLFFDRHGREGSNAVLRLEQRALKAPEGAGWIDIFLDRVVAVRHLDRHELEPEHPAA